MAITEIKINNIIAAGESTKLQTVSSPVRGIIVGVKVVYNAGGDRAVDVYEMNPAAPTTVAKNLQHILDHGSSGATPVDDNAVFYPMAYAEDNAGTDLTYDGTNEIATPFVVFSPIIAVYVDGTAADDTTVYLLVKTR